MRSTVILGVLLLAAGSAHADGWYYAESFGATKVHDELATHLSDPTMFRYQFAVGHRFGPWAVEGSVVGNLSTDGYLDPISSPDLGGLELDVKYLQPVARHLEVYIRGGAGYGWADGNLRDYSGRNLGFGAGIQLKGKGSVAGLLFWPLFFLIDKGPQMTGAIFIDDGFDFYRLHDGDKTAIDAQLTHFNVGPAVGTDF